MKPPTMHAEGDRAKEKFCVFDMKKGVKFVLQWEHGSRIDSVLLNFSSPCPSSLSFLLIPYPFMMKSLIAPPPSSPEEHPDRPHQQ